MLRLLSLLRGTEALCTWDEKVLYTNGSGLLLHPQLVDALQLNSFDRIELSRCHWDQEVNQRIMRFNRTQPVWKNEGYASMLQQVHPHLHVRNSCILTADGVSDLQDVEAYLEFAASLGVREVVFRELSRTGDAYETSRFTDWIGENRVPINDIMDAVLGQSENPAPGWEYLYSTLGYYYYNEHYAWKGGMEVILETSSYPALMEANASGVTQKLVYHSNGNLCGDWDPENCIIGNYGYGS